MSTLSCTTRSSDRAPTFKARGFAPETRGACQSCANLADLSTLCQAEEEAICMALELMTGGDLDGLIRRGGAMPEGAVASVSAQIAAGLSHLHRKRASLGDPGQTAIRGVGVSGETQLSDSCKQHAGSERGVGPPSQNTVARLPRVFLTRKDTFWGSGRDSGPFTLPGFAQASSTVTSSPLTCCSVGRTKRSSRSRTLAWPSAWRRPTSAHAALCPCIL